MKSWGADMSAPHSIVRTPHRAPLQGAREGRAGDHQRLARLISHTSIVLGRRFPERLPLQRGGAAFQGSEAPIPRYPCVLTNLLCNPVHVTPPQARPE